MKKFVFTALMALASIWLVNSNHLRAQDSSQITISDPAEFNAYQNASTQTDAKAKAKALEDFLKAYPQSVVKKAVLDQLIDAYQAAGDQDGALSAATRLLQIDANYPKALFISVYIKKNQCGKTSDAATCDDAAALAQKGLAAPKPASTKDDDWKKLTAAMYPVYHSAIALDDIVSKKDIKAAIQEYRTELNLYSLADTTKGQGLVDTLQLAEAYAKPDARDMVLACWFYARAWDYAPATYQGQIEPKLEYWYKRYHGNLEGLDALKTAAKATLFPADTSIIKAAPRPDELAHTALTSGDPATLSLSDKEYILANGTDEDAQKLWAILQAQELTPVPGTVLEANASVYKVSVTTAKEPAKPQEFIVKMATPTTCDAVPAPPSELKVKDAQAYLQQYGAKDDTDAMGELMTAAPAQIKKFVIVPAVSVVKVAVTQEAKDAKTADFIVNMKEKEPVSCKEAPKVGSETKPEPPNQLNATYDKFTKVAASGGNEPSAQLVMKDGFMGQEEKKTATKPAAGHAATTHKTK